MKQSLFSPLILPKGLITAWGIVLLFLESVAVCAEPNVLSPQEKVEGWKLLFDGKSAAGWRGVEKEGFPAEGWEVKDGVLKVLKGRKGGDIVTAEQFENYEFAWEWNINEGGNSGVKYNMPNPKVPLGCEFQLLDDEKHEDGIRGGPIRQTGALYDLIAADSEKKKLNPPGEWNTSRLVVRGNHVEHWLNGEKILAYELGSDALRAKIAQSKYKNDKGFGEKVKSPILLQDHGDEISFRNIKIRIYE